MSPRKYLSLLGGCCGLVLLLTLPVAAEIPAMPPDGVEVLGRGPVHEAYAQPVDAQPEPGIVVPQEPPALIDEVPPDQKPEGDNVQWVPGYWQWDEDRKDFIWISGFWRVPPPGRQWVAGHYRKGDAGWQWVSGYWAGTEQTEESLLPPPPPPLDTAASVPAPSDDSVYVPGTWVYRETRYRWRPGFYVDYRPGWVWNPARYVWTPAGYVFVEGYWDYPLQNRGLLFAPVAIERRVIEPNWCYTPSYVIAPDFLPCALFARPAWGHYYFGDYFDAGYARRGFTAWIDVRIGRNYRDPLYDYDRRYYGREGRDRDLRDLYTGRFNGDIPRPPRTLVQQNAYVKNVTINNTTIDNSVRVNKTVNVFKSVTPLAPLNNGNPRGVKLAAVNAGERKAFTQNVGQVRDLARQRQESEMRVLSAHAAPTRPGDSPHAMKLDLPRVAPPKVVARPPTAPVHEKPVVKVAERNNPLPTDSPPHVNKEVVHQIAPVRHEVAAPPVKHEAMPTMPKHEVPPAPANHETPPLMPKMSKHEVPAPVKHETAVPAPPRHETPPPPKHEAPPAPVKREVPPPPPRRETVPPPPPQREMPPPPPARHEAPPPPRHEAPPPPAPRRDPPAPPKHEAPPPKHEAPPPPPSKAPAQQDQKKH